MHPSIDKVTIMNLETENMNQERQHSQSQKHVLGSNLQNTHESDEIK